MFKRCVTVITAVSIFLLCLRVPQAGATAPSPRTKDKKGACAPCSAGLQGDAQLSGLDALATLGRRTQALPFAPLSRSVFDGATVNLVSTARGHLAFYVTDMALSGALPIKFERVYTSDRGEDAGLGAGWSFVFDDRITINGDSAQLTTGGGLTAYFRRDADTRRFVLKTAEPGGRQSFSLDDEETITERADGMTRTYRKMGAEYRLSRIKDSNGNQINITFDARGNLTRVANDGGGAIVLEWSDGGGDARLLAVADTAGQRVAFKQDGRRLRSVTDSTGAQLSYDYADNRLTRAADPLRRNVLRVSYDRAGRVVEAGDAAGAYLFQYDAASGVSRRTIVTDPSGARIVYEHTAAGLLTAAGDGEGLAARFEYNAANRVTSISGMQGAGATRFTYDEQNRLLRQSTGDGKYAAYTYDGQGRVSSKESDGSRTVYTRDERGNVLSAESGDAAVSYTAVLNARGQAVSLKSAAGREVASEYDEAGNETAFSVSGVGRFETERDRAGRVVSERLPSGLSIGYEYDARGRLAKQSDSRGRSLVFERDASGALTGVVTAEGKWVRAARDEVGRIVALTNSAGKSRRFTYDARGGLTDYTDALGKRKRVGYDRHGRVREVSTSAGGRVVIERDAQGRARLKGEAKGPAARLMAAVFNHGAARPQSSFECFFDYDGFFDSGSFYTSGGGGLESGSGGGFGSFGWDSFNFFSGSFTCSDPFGSGSCSWYGGFDSWYADPWLATDCGYGGETCADCMSRQNRVCQRERSACSWRAAGTTLLSVAGCVGLTLTTVVGGVICIALVFGSTGTSGIACSEDFLACQLRARNNCPQCNN